MCGVVFCLFFLQRIEEIMKRTRKMDQNDDKASLCLFFLVVHC